MRFHDRAAIALIALVPLGALPGLAQAPTVLRKPAPAVQDDPRVQLLKQDLTEAILGKMKESSGKEPDVRWSGRVRRQLLTLDVQQLQEGAEAGRIPRLARLAVAPLIGDSGHDLVYTPITPCRILDTRAGAGHRGSITGPLAPGATYSFDVAGGDAAACGVPYGPATAAVLNFVAVLPAGSGNLQAWPWSSPATPAPNAAVLNYGSGFNIANGLVVPFCDPTVVGTCPDDLFVKANGNGTHLVVDVLGYFSAPEATPLECATATASFSADSGEAMDATATCDAGYQVTGGGLDYSTLPATGTYIHMSARSGNGWRCQGFNDGSSSWQGTCQAVCCRTPGLD